MFLGLAFLNQGWTDTATVLKNDEELFHQHCQTQIVDRLKELNGLHIVIHFKYVMNLVA